MVFELIFIEDLLNRYPEMKIILFGDDKREFEQYKYNYLNNCHQNVPDFFYFKNNQFKGAFCDIKIGNINYQSKGTYYKLYYDINNNNIDSVINNYTQVLHQRYAKLETNIEFISKKYN